MQIVEDCARLAETSRQSRDGGDGVVQRKKNNERRENGRFSNAGGAVGGSWSLRTPFNWDEEPPFAEWIAGDCEGLTSD